MRNRSSAAHRATILRRDDENRRAGRHIRREIRPARCRIIEGRGALEAFIVLCAIGTWMLYGDKECLSIRREAWPADFGTHRCAEQASGKTALLACGGERKKPVRTA